jgi:hypothetical protein
MKKKRKLKWKQNKKEKKNRRMTTSKMSRM